MGKSVLFLCLLLAVVGISVSEDVAPAKKKAGRQPRNYDGGYADFASYYKQDESKEQPEQPVYTDSGSKPQNPPPRTEPFGNFKVYKGNFNYPGNFPLVFKGYPYYYGKGQQPSASPEQPPMMDMMSMMDMMKQLQEQGDSGKEPGFLQKLMSDPKTILVAALIPVSIMLASFIPLLVNYFMSGSSVPSLITSLASGSAGRSLMESDFLHTLLRGIDRYGRSLESHGCLEEAVCQFVTDSSSVDGGEFDNVKMAARSISKVLKTEWLGDGRLATLASGIRRTDCSNVCEKSRSRKKKGDLSE